MAQKKTTLYKYISVEHAAEIINSGRLRLSDGSDFNDPFELLEIDAGTGTESRVHGLRILCLTNSTQNKLMWSHYAKNHEGICLAIQVPADLVYALCYTSHRVKTTDDIDVVVANSKHIVKKNLVKPYTSLSREKKIALLKDKCWMYEKEYRIVLADDDALLTEEAGSYYLPVKITAIYLGTRFQKNSVDVKDNILNACKAHGITIKKAVMSLDSYAINIKSGGHK